MPVTKQNLPIPFVKGLDTKTDPFQVSAGKFLSLNNVVFNKAGQLQKRNGFGLLTALPTGASATTLTTFNGNLLAVGQAIYAYSQDTAQWLNMGRIQPVQLSVEAIYRSSYSQVAVDSAVASNGLVCTTFLDGDGSYKYLVSDSVTGQVVIPAATLPNSGVLTKVFALGNYFIVTYQCTITATVHLQYVAISTISLTVSSATDISTVVNASAGYDGSVANGFLYLAWAGSDVAIHATSLSLNLALVGSLSVAAHTANLMSVAIDTSATTPVIWLTYWDTASRVCYTSAYNQSFTQILAPTTLFTSGSGNPIKALTSLASNQSISVFSEVSSTYSYSATVSDFVNQIQCTQAGVVGSNITLIRGVGLASKAFYFNSKPYFVGAYGQTYQPTYFLISSTGFTGEVIAKIAYSNGGGYVTNQILPSVSLTGNVAQFSYLFKDLLTSVNKSQGSPSVNGIYSQTGINLASVTMSVPSLSTAEIGNNLHIAGGFVWMYDGAQIVEHNYHVWPEDILLTGSASGGLLTAQQYFYQVVYEWTDAQGNIHRSAPSVPQTVTTTGSTSSVTLNIPCLRLTYKKNVRICIYRWSAAQQSYFQVTSIASPLLNVPTSDSVSFVDTLADSAIIGNQLIYTAGGVVENVAYPASAGLALFKSRLFSIDSEDGNTLSFSKQVISGTCVEPSDLFTQYIPPTTGALGSTGVVRAIAPLDDKLICFKKGAIYFFTGIGPDNTGADNDFVDAQFVTSTVGSVNQNSITFLPSGLIFQSDKGLWLLNRGLSTEYIGAPVEQYNSSTVLNSLTIPGTNQIRLTLGTNTLMYDYFYGEWGTFSGIPGISSTLFNNLHTFLNSSGQVYQETPASYLDGFSPVNISFTTNWYNLAGLQGYQRAYFFYLLGTYLTPHKLQVQIAYDYNPSLVQTATISPVNIPSTWGSDALWGSSAAWGASDNIEQFRVFFSTQKCQSFQISIQESYDNSFSTVPGAGLTLSGLNFVVGIKKGYKTQSASTSTG